LILPSSIGQHHRDLGLNFSDPLTNTLSDDPKLLTTDKLKTQARCENLFPFSALLTRPLNLSLHQKRCRVPTECEL
jgi:hypothetical protein